MIRTMIAAGLVVAGLALASAHVRAAYDHEAFEAAMESTNRNYRAVIAAAIASDWAKTGASASALAADAKVIRGLTPKENAGRLAEYQANADSLAARAHRLVLAAKARRAGASANLAGEVLAACATCHEVFRK
jgi:cytochrome c556